MVTQGNHEVEKIPVIHPESFTSYNARWRMPFEESGSDSNLYYSFDVAGVHIVMLGSYTDFDPSSAQYKWLQADLGKVDRTRTPWIVVLIHAPWYNSNTAHQGEKESVGMKASMEGLLYQARVDVVFAGHVHAYERFVSFQAFSVLSFVEAMQSSWFLISAIISLLRPVSTMEMPMIVVQCTSPLVTAATAKALPKGLSRVPCPNASFCLSFFKI